MEPPQGAEDQHQLQLVWGTGGTAACLCPAAVAAAAGAPASSLFPRHSLEQEVLHRADLQLPGGVGRGGGDRRRERQVKNRESVARSRQRKYAYLSELEKEVRLLRAENEELRKLCEELKEAAEAPTPVKKAPGHQLQRTTSAPF